MSNSLVVHMIGQAHIDPVWLWRRAAGIDEVLDTCRSAADRLDEYPEFIFTRSDTWVYEQVESLDPTLFERIRAFVAEGRWAIVGGWYIQPDCNFPSGTSFRKHIEISRDYIQDRFSVKVDVGYNVDSFGHAATLPDLLNEYGYDAYVFMRPEEHEKPLPGPLFRWQGQRGGEVLTWRILPPYCTNVHTDLGERVRRAIDNAPRDVGHVMCFYGVGNHGGGPTKENIEYILDHRDAFDGARLEFSHPRRFFDAVAAHREQAPPVSGELQFHSIGCYSVVRDIKRHTRFGERILTQAEAVLDRFPEHARPNDRERVKAAWSPVLFNQFHDTIAGTCLASAYPEACAELGHARYVGEQVVETTVRRAELAGRASRTGRAIIALNTADAPRLSPWMEHEPDIGEPWKRKHLTDDGGRVVPCQVIHQEAATAGRVRLLIKAPLEANELKHVWVSDGKPPGAGDAGDLTATPTELANERLIVRLGSKGIEQVACRETGVDLLAPGGSFAEVLSDKTDTWSHGIDRYSGPALGQFVSRRAWRIEEQGPLRAAAGNEFRFKQSRIIMTVRLYTGESRIELRLRVDWRGKRQLLKLRMPLPFDIASRDDGIPDGYLSRPCDGTELPFQNFMLLRGSAGGRDAGIGLIMPDTYAAEVDGSTVGLTLLRGPVFAHHDPTTPGRKRFPRYTDQGEHEFSFDLLPDPSLTPGQMTARAAQLSHPVHVWDRTVSTATETGLVR